MFHVPCWQRFPPNLDDGPHLVWRRCWRRCRQLEVLRCNYDLSKFRFITNCQVVLYVVQVWLFENGPSRSGVNRWRLGK
jgi:hypothetical protein